MDSDTEGLNEEHKKMLQWLKTVRFRKRFFNGISERDVWKKLDELNGLYEASILAERVRYDTMMKSFVRSKDARIEEYKKALLILQKKNEALEKAYREEAAVQREGSLSRKRN